MERDRESIGVTVTNQAILADLGARGWFPELQDIARFCMSYAVRARVPEGVTAATETRWAAGNFDKTGEMRIMLAALYPDCKTPIRLMEHLVNEGLRLVEGKLASGGDLAALFEPVPDEDSRAVLLYEKFEIVKAIGGGGMAETFCVRSLIDRSLFFLKRVWTGSLDERALRREQQIYVRLQQVEDPALLRVVGWERDAASVALVMEYADGGSLTEHVQASGGSLTVAAAKKVASQVINSVAALHAANVVHRDIKPDNVVLAGSLWKLADFGIAKNLARPVTHHTFLHHHTPGYAPPEQVEGSQASEATDVYAFGKLLAYMLTGQTDPDKIMSPACRSLVRDCTQADPRSRISVDEIRRAISRLVA